MGAGRLDQSGVCEVGGWMGCGMKGFNSLGQGSYAFVLFGLVYMEKSFPDPCDIFLWESC